MVAVYVLIAIGIFFITASFGVDGFSGALLLCGILSLLAAGFGICVLRAERVKPRGYRPYIKPRIPPTSSWD